MLKRTIVLAMVLTSVALRPARLEAGSGSSGRFEIRGHGQTLHLYGTRGGPVAIVSSGDGGWVHLAPEVAQFLESEGWFVVGFDAKAYLSGFTSGSSTLSPEDVPRDYAALVAYAARGARGRPLLFGVSEGAGLSVLAATAPGLKEKIAGVVALGLPERNELGWRFRDQMIYFTKKTPKEPLFSAREVVGRVSPVPLVLVRSTHDEFVPPPESDAIWAEVKEPRLLFTIAAADHRFSDNQPELWRRLKEGIEWIARQDAGSR